LDSLTQIVLGAAVGEVVLGRKVGNRAMIWGAIAGTIPDLDIIANAFMHPIEALAVHRGLSHSIFFAALFPWLIGWMTHRYYENDMQNNKSFNWILRSLIILLCLVFVNGIAYEIQQGISWTTALVSLAVVGLYIGRTYFSDQKLKSTPEADYYDWVKLHFWAIFTHPLLDSCTTYGTQLFQPFSDYRVAFNNIAVADPAYTAPFLVCVIVASFFIKSSFWRKFFNVAGLTISSLYLMWSLYNKYRVNQVFERSFAEKNIVYDRYMTTPTILNNILWFGVAQKDDTYYTGFYSLLDEEARVLEFEEVKQNEELIAPWRHHRYIEVIKWFSNGYYSVRQDGEDRYIFSDLRYGIVKPKDDGGKKSESVFSFIIETGEEFEVTPLRDPDTRDGDALKLFWERIRGSQAQSRESNPSINQSTQ